MSTDRDVICWNQIVVADFVDMEVGRLQLTVGPEMQVGG